MRKFVSIICAAAVAMTSAMTVSAAPSIGQLIPEEPVLVSGIDMEEFADYALNVQDVVTENYKSDLVKDVVELFNDNDEPITITDVLDRLKVDRTKEIKTNKNKTIVPEDYEPLMPFVDLNLKHISNDKDLRYDVNYAEHHYAKGAKKIGTVETEAETEAADDEFSIEATITVEVAKDFEQEDLVIMEINPDTEDVYFLELEDYEPETGKLTAKFPCLGPFTIMADAEAVVVSEGETETVS